MIFKFTLDILFVVCPSALTVFPPDPIHKTGPARDPENIRDLVTGHASGPGGGQAELLSNVRSNNGEAGSPGDTPHHSGMNIEHRL